MQLKAVCWTALLLMGTAKTLPATQARPPKSEKPRAGASQVEPLPGLSASIESLSGRVGRSVVQVFTTGYSLGGDGERSTAGLLSQQRTSGSGFLLSSDGLIMTNAHVVQGARRVRVRLSGAEGTPGRRLLEAKVIATDHEADLALIKIDATNLPFLTLADSSQLKQGQLVFAFGNPLGLDNSVSMGVVAAADRQLSPDSPLVYIQTDAAINPGNSGGPLVDAEGRVIGINTFIFSQSGGSEGIGFAIPSNIVRSVFNQMRQGGHVHHHQIGVFAKTITPALAAGLGLAREDGVLIEDVVPASPAATAGLHVGDIILSVGDKPIQNIRQFVSNLYESSVAETTRIQILRGRDQISLEISVVERTDDPLRFADMVSPAENQVRKLGILALAIDDELRPLLPPLRHGHGVIVAARTAESDYSGDRLELGDVIYSINGKPVEDVMSLRARLDELKPEDPVVLQVERSGRMTFLVLEAN